MSSRDLRGSRPPPRALGHGPGHHGTLVAIATPVVLRFLAERADRKLGPIREAMGLPPGGDLARAVAELNGRLALPRTASELGYEARDPEELAEAAETSLFHATSALRPGRSELAAIIGDTLG